MAPTFPRSRASSAASRLNAHSILGSMANRNIRCTGGVHNTVMTAAALALAYWVGPHMNSAWFYHRDSAQELGAPWWAGVVMTFALFGCSMVLTTCFFAWVPRRKMWFTVLGAGTLYGYLLHGFLVKFADYRGWFDHPWLHRPLGEILVTLAFGAAVTVLCTKPVQRVFRFAMEPKMEWAFKQDAAELARERQRREREREKVGA